MTTKISAMGAASALGGTEAFEAVQSAATKKVTAAQIKTFVESGYASGVATFLVTPSGANLASALTTALPASKGGTGLTALGTNVATALGVNIGSAGAPVLLNGAGGTPSSITLINGTALPLATGIAGLSKGTSNPGSPSSGDVFWRSDLKLLIFYDGTRWLTVNEYSATFVQVGATSVVPASANVAAGSALANMDTAQSGVWVERFVQTTYVVATNNGSLYWTVQFGSVDSAGSMTNLGSSFNTSADTQATNVLHTVTVGAAVAAGAKGLSYSATKTSTPGNLYSLPAIVFYRLIVT